MQELLTTSRISINIVLANMQNVKGNTREHRYVAEAYRKDR
jgi:hypothetical protein